MVKTKLRGFAARYSTLGFSVMLVQGTGSERSIRETDKRLFRMRMKPSCSQKSSG